MFFQCVQLALRLHSSLNNRHDDAFSGRTTSVRRRFTLEAYRLAIAISFQSATTATITTTTYDNINDLYLRQGPIRGLLYLCVVNAAFLLQNQGRIHLALELRQFIEEVELEISSINVLKSNANSSNFPTSCGVGSLGLGLGRESDDSLGLVCIAVLAMKYNSFLASLDDQDPTLSNNCHLHPLHLLDIDISDGDNDVDGSIRRHWHWIDSDASRDNFRKVTNLLEDCITFRNSSIISNKMCCSVKLFNHDNHDIASAIKTNPLTSNKLQAIPFKTVIYQLKVDLHVLVAKMAAAARQRQSKSQLSNTTNDVTWPLPKATHNHMNLLVEEAMALSKLTTLRSTFADWYAIESLQHQRKQLFEMMLNIVSGLSIAAMVSNTCAVLSSTAFILSIYYFIILVGLRIIAMIMFFI